MESLKAELALARSNAESAARVMTTKSAGGGAGELYEQSQASGEEGNAGLGAREEGARGAEEDVRCVGEEITRHARARGFGRGEVSRVEDAQKPAGTLESNGDAAFAQSPPSSTTPRTLRQSHRDVREYAAQRVGSLENDVKSTKREATAGHRRISIQS